MRASFRFLSPGSVGTRETIAVMRQLAVAQHAFPLVRRVAVALTATSGTDAALQAARIRQFLASKVRFLRDPRYTEALTRPDALLTTIQQRGYVVGDCDDVALLGATLALAIGLRAKYVALGRDGFEHIYTVVGPPDGSAWYQLDTTRPYQDVPSELLRRLLVVEV